MAFGDKIKELRQAVGMTQDALAKASGIPIGTIRDYEQGKRDPLLSNAQRLAGALKVSLDVFTTSPVNSTSPATRGRLKKSPAGQDGAAVKRGRPRKSTA